MGITDSRPWYTRGVRALATVVVMLLAASPARGERVVEETSRWTAAHDLIVTDLIIERDDGSLMRVTVPGGSVDGIALRQYHVGAGGGDWSSLYVPERTKKASQPLYWESGCVFLTPDVDGVSDLAGTDELDVIDDVIAYVQATLDGCSYLQLRRDQPRDLQSGYDGVNAIMFREDSWCRPATGDEPEFCYPQASIAVTNIYHLDKPGDAHDGRILDTDIEFNAVDYAVAVCDEVTGMCTTGGAGPNADLANTLTHELGHVLGLDHTCWDQPGAAPLDADGNVVPSCFPEGNLSQDVRDATMYNFQDANETKKRTFAPDDIAGLCAIYPTSMDPGNCDRTSLDDGGWCAIAAGAPRTRSGRDVGALALLGGAMIALAALKRRRTT